MQNETRCPHCNQLIQLSPSEVAQLLRAITSTKRTTASQNNGKRGGRPKGAKNKPKPLN